MWGKMSEGVVRVNGLWCKWGRVSGGDIGLEVIMKMV